MSKKGSDRPVERKILDVIYQKVIDPDKGIVESLVSVYGNIDHGKDRIMSGAFKKSVQEGVQKVLVLDQHNTHSIFATLGKAQSMREVNRSGLPPEVQAQFPDATGGLICTTKYLLNTPEGHGAFERIKEGAINQYSIGFEALDIDHATVKARRTETGYQLDAAGLDLHIRNLRTCKLVEYSPVLWGMNEATATISAKDAEGSAAASDDSPESTPEGETLEPQEEAVTEGAADNKEMTASGPVRRMGDVLTGHIHQMFTMLADDWLISGMMSQDERIALSGAIGAALDVFNQSAPPEVLQRPLSQNSFFMMGRIGEQIAVIKTETPPEPPSPLEEKAGRVISQANAQKLTAALSALNAGIENINSILANAGLLDDEPADTDDKAAQAQAETPSPVQTDSASDDQRAGQDDPPTPRTKQEIDLEYVNSRLHKLSGLGGLSHASTTNAVGGKTRQGGSDLRRYEAHSDRPERDTRREGAVGGHAR